MVGFILKFKVKISMFFTYLEIGALEIFPVPIPFEMD
jgi:hypothetical protein